MAQPPRTPQPLPSSERPRGGQRGAVADSGGRDDVEQLRARVVDMLRDSAGQADTLIDAGELARRLGVGRTWVYANAELLGAIRLGDGPRPRLRFDPMAVARALAGVESTPTDGSPQRLQRRRALARGDDGLLPIDRSRGPRGAVARIRRVLLS